MSRRRRVVVTMALAAGSAGAAVAQDTTIARLAPVRVTVSRESARSTLELPFGVSQVSVDSARMGARRGSLTDLLLGVPGLAVSNRHNPTQDPRLAIRGFGARAAFGIRGIRVVRDGLPLTLADGQTAVDFVDLESVGSAEVMRGAAGALYGNASGGVLELRTLPPGPERFRGGARGVINEDATRWSANAAGRLQGGSLGWQGTATRNTGDGPRDYSRFRSTSFFGDVQKDLGAQGRLRAQLTVYDAPVGENPGAVTAAELRAAPWVADSQNIRRKATKSVGQTLLSLQGERVWEGGSATAGAFGGTRDLANPQAFAIVEFDRRVLGATARLQQRGTWRRHAWRLSAGSDVQSQRDDRRNFVNCAANAATTCRGLGDRGPETVHQLERVVTAGAFVRGEVARDYLALTGTVRGDRTGFTVRDRRVTSIPGGSIQSLHMGAVTPMLGVTVRPGRALSVYANFAGSFETPTTTELANQPDGSTRVNRDLEAQRGRTVEAGVKGLARGRVLYDLAVFDISTTDELIPFEIPNSGGRRYFRNAGRTARRGVEAAASTTLGTVDLGLAVTRLVYTYEDFRVGTTVLDGKRVPGVAPTTSSAYATLRRRLGFLSAEVQQSARTPVDDANANHAPAWVLWSVRGGLHLGRTLGLEPVVGVENLFDRTYSANVVTNATRGRFYEPGAGRRVYVSVGVRGRSGR